MAACLIKNDGSRIEGTRPCKDPPVEFTIPLGDFDGHSKLLFGILVGEQSPCHPSTNEQVNDIEINGRVTQRCLFERVSKVLEYNLSGNLLFVAWILSLTTLASCIFCRMEGMRHVDDTHTWCHCATQTTSTFVELFLCIDDGS